MQLLLLILLVDIILIQQHLHFGIALLLVPTTWQQIAGGGGSNPTFTIVTTDPTSSTVGVVGAGIFNTTNNVLWICIAVNTGSPTTYTWQSPSGSGTAVGNCTVVTKVDPGNSNFPIGNPYISTDDNSIIGIPIPLNSLTNDYTYFAGSGYIGTTRYIQSTGTRTIYGDSMICSLLP